MVEWVARGALFPHLAQSLYLNISLTVHTIVPHPHHFDRRRSKFLQLLFSSIKMLLSQRKKRARLSNLGSNKRWRRSHTRRASRRILQRLRRPVRMFVAIVLASLLLLRFGGYQTVSLRMNVPSYIRSPYLSMTSNVQPYHSAPISTHSFQRPLYMNLNLIQRDGMITMILSGQTAPKLHSTFSYPLANQAWVFAGHCFLLRSSSIHRQHLLAMV